MPEGDAHNRDPQTVLSAAEALLSEAAHQSEPRFPWFAARTALFVLTPLVALSEFREMFALKEEWSVDLVTTIGLLIALAGVILLTAELHRRRQLKQMSLEARLLELRAEASAQALTRN